jgi:hypothetical protein
MRHCLLSILLFLLATAGGGHAQVLDAAMHHLRHGAMREWDDFSEKAEADNLRLTFDAQTNNTAKTLSVRHRDLRHVWKVILNGKDLGKLPQDDNTMITLLDVPSDALRQGSNEIRIVCTETSDEPDDVEIGDISLLDQTRKDLLSESSIDISVIDADSSKPLPCRLTIVDARGVLVPLGIESNVNLAVRPGVVYTGTGRATLQLPAGNYTLYAGRGFEWGIDSAKLHLRAGKNDAKHLTIRREIDTDGYVAADTHIHTFTYSRHGDATLAERMITLAGEGIELPIATDHNLPIDYTEPAKAADVRQYFTPVIGDEVTTAKLGHFNVFPLDKSAPLIDFRAPTWNKLFKSIDSLAPNAVVILNHARDDHGGFRPFDPNRHLSLTGEDLDGMVLRANAMEVINSGATLNDPLLLYRDWMGCLNHGEKLAPIGASDSHDVSRFIVGQGRTYIRTADGDPSNIDIAKACEAIKAGRVLVSYGLLVDLKVDGRFAPGDLAAADGESTAEIKISGPAWTRAEHLELYANGIKIRTAEIDADHGSRPGLKFSIDWRLGKFLHDVFLTAIATGPGVTAPYWPGAKPYQRTSSHWVPYVLGCSGAVYLDADGSGKFESAFDYADGAVAGAKGEVAPTIEALRDYDASVAAQAAGILRSRGKLAGPQAAEDLATRASGDVRAGFEAYARAWRESDKVRTDKMDGKKP